MSAEVVRFPKAKKRGRKRMTGPAATLLSFQLDEARQKQWAWLSQNHGDWNNEQLNGEPSGMAGRTKDWHQYMELCRVIRKADGNQFNDVVMRAEIADYTAQIKRRSALKDWLEAIGIDWHVDKSPEDALYFVFDHLVAQKV